MESVRQGAFATNGNLWRNHLSAQAKDVITRMLEVDPDRRLSAQEALAHPFFRKEAGEGEGERDAKTVGAEAAGERAGGVNDAEAAAMRGVLIARTSQHLKEKQQQQQQQRHHLNGNNDNKSDGQRGDGGGISGWLRSVWRGGD